MRCRPLIITTLTITVIGTLAGSLLPPSDHAATSRARDALTRAGINVANRTPSDITASQNAKLVSFDAIDGYDYVVQVRNRWTSPEIHRMPSSQPTE